MKNQFFKNITGLAPALCLGSILLVSSCSAAQSSVSSIQASEPVPKAVQETQDSLSALPHRPHLDTAIFAGGCFWCVESDFEKLPGVLSVVSGYTGGGTPDPSYKNHGQHYEAAKVFFDATKVTYEDLLDYYWLHVDPTDPDGQFCDKGHSYKTAIFARPEQMDAAESSKAQIMKSKPFADPIVTPILNTETFWTAEEYHQDYYKKNPVRYKLYRKGCGRDARLKALWNQ